MLLGSLVALTAASSSAQAEPDPAPRPQPIPLVQEWPLELPAHHVQGLSASADHFWVSTVDRQARKGWVFRIDRETLKVVASREVTDGSRFHPGGIQEVNGALWVPVAEYRPKSSTTVLKLDPKTLQTLGSFGCDDHLGAIAADGKGTLFAVNWDAELFYTFDESGKLKQKRETLTRVAYQDIDYDDGMLYGCGQAKIDDAQGAVVDAIDPEKLELQVRYLLHPGPIDEDRHFGREGFAKFQDNFFVLPDDGPRTAIYRFGLPTQ